MANPTGAKVNVLIVDDIVETRENIRKLLQFEPDIEVIDMARTGKEAIQKAKELRPHVILMDINMPDMDGIQATEQIVREVPSAQIVMVSVQSDTDYMRRAMLAGARDFLSKPPSADELINAVRRLGEVSRQQEQRVAAYTAAPVAAAAKGREAKLGLGGKVIVVFSPKGGAGCTTLATNLAIALHSEETKAVLVDANLQFGDVGVFLNLKTKNSLVSLMGQNEEMEDEVFQSVLVPHTSGLKVLLGPPSPEDAELVSSANLRKLIGHLRNSFAYVVVDTAPVLRDVELSLFDEADRVVLIATPDIPSLKNVKLCFDLFEKLEYPGAKLLLVMNRIDKRAGISAADVEKTLKHAVKGQILQDDKSVQTSINSGVPLLVASRTVPTAQNILDLAQKIRDEFAVKETPEEDKKKTQPRGFGQLRR